MELACGRRGPPRLLRGTRSLRRWAASGRRHRARWGSDSPGARLGRRHLRRQRADQRLDGHDRHPRRAQGLADPPRKAARRARSPSGRWRPDRRARTLGRSRARRAVRAPRNPGGGRRDVRGPALAPSLARGADAIPAIARAEPATGARPYAVTGSCPGSHTGGSRTGAGRSPILSSSCDACAGRGLRVIRCEPRAAAGVGGERVAATCVSSACADNAACFRLRWKRGGWGVEVGEDSTLDVTAHAIVRLGRADIRIGYEPRWSRCRLHGDARVEAGRRRVRGRPRRIAGPARLGRLARAGTYISGLRDLVRTTSSRAPTSLSPARTSSFVGLRPGSRDRTLRARWRPRSGAGRPETTPYDWPP